MLPHFLAICTGNTYTRLGTYVDDELIDHRSTANAERDEVAAQVAEAAEPLRDKQSACAVMATVKPQVSDAIAAQVTESLKLKTYRIEEDLRIPIGRQLDPEAIVGDDRLLNAAAAYDVLRQACVVVDAGTAITVDYVDGTGTYHGGAIAPGARSMLAALHDHTAQLPRVEWKPPTELIGHSTLQAMRCGVFHGLRGMVRELVEHYAEYAGSYPIVIATGGDARVLFEHYDLIDRVVPELTLTGIAVTVRSAFKSDAAQTG